MKITILFNTTEVFTKLHSLEIRKALESADYIVHAKRKCQAEAFTEYVTRRNGKKTAASSLRSADKILVKKLMSQYFLKKATENSEMNLTIYPFLQRDALCVH